MRKSLSLMIAFLLFMAGSILAQDKIKIEKLDDLPRHTYKIEKKAADFIKDQDAVMALAAKIKKDLESDLAKYEIEDKTTLKAYYSDLGLIAMLEGRYDDYLKFLDKRKNLEEKEAQKLMAGFTGSAIVKAKSSDVQDENKVIYNEIKKKLASIPYETVEANVKQYKGMAEILSENFVIGQAQSGLQPVIDKTDGVVSKDIANSLINMRYLITFYIPAKDAVHKALSEYIEANNVEKEDIWEEREVTFTGKEEAKPVVIAVWDSGLDTDIEYFKPVLWNNKKETPGNNKDDDGNGYIDDVHGIAYSLHGDKETSVLYPLPEMKKDEKDLQRQMKGLEDITSAIESEEATELKKMMSTLSPAEVKPFLEELQLYGNYAHGTHVAGISVKGNPFVKLLAARITFDYHMIPEKPTIEQAKKDAKALVETVDYFKKNGVRAVNMSWGGSLASVEAALEAHNVGETPEDRKKLAREIYEIGDKKFRESIKNAGDILFITSAGNSDNDVKFEEFYPSSYDYPNILSVGAVDQAGDETSFTSFGKVDVYANGFEVESYVPGGHRMKMSGTSQASPQVLNLAGKLLTLNPDLTTAQLKELIIKGCDIKKAGDREVKLINPKKSIELLKKM